MGERPERIESRQESLLADRERVTVLVCYALHMAGALAVLPAIVALIVNYLRRGEAGEVLASHHSWMIRTFWWNLAWVLLGIITATVYVGLAILLAVWIWWWYRHVRGLLALLDDRALPA